MFFFVLGGRLSTFSEGVWMSRASFALFDIQIGWVPRAVVAAMVPTSGILGFSCVFPNMSGPQVFWCSKNLVALENKKKYKNRGCQKHKTLQKPWQLAKKLSSFDAKTSQAVVAR